MSDAPERAEPPLVVVRRFWYPWDSHLALSALDAAGIQARLADDATIAIDWTLANALGGVRLWVRAADAREADELLGSVAQPVPDEWRELTGDQGGGPGCPRCGGTDLGTILHNQRVAVALWLLLGLPLCPVWRRACCRSCGYTFRRQPQPR